MESPRRVAANVFPWCFWRNKEKTGTFSVIINALFWAMVWTVYFSPYNSHQVKDYAFKGISGQRVFAFFLSGLLLEDYLYTWGLLLFGANSSLK